MAENQVSGSLFSLSGKVALVTGPASGIGQAIAVGYAAAGAELILVGRRANMDETLSGISQAGGNARSLHLDLSDIKAIEGSMQDLIAEHRVDILVNNAGVIHRQEAIDVGWDDWANVLDTNLNAAFLLAQAVARPMIARGHGKIINVASLASFYGSRSAVSYVVSKHGMVGLTRALSNEWAPHGLQVNAIAPGFTKTKVTDALREDAARNREILSRIPAGRWAVPEDMVGPAVFLASAASNYVTGHVLVVDGGWLAD